MKNIRTSSVLTVLLTGIAVILLSLFCFNSTVLAAGDPVLYLTSNATTKSKIGNIVSSINDYADDVGLVGDFMTLGMSASGEDMITINMTNYRNLDASDKSDLMRYALDTISASELPQNHRLKLYNFVAEQDAATSALVRQLSEDVSADYATAYTWFKPFTGGISTLFGVLTLGIFICLALTIVIDLAYLALPLVRGALDRDDGKKPKIVSNEAYKAVLASEQDNKGNKQAVGIYFKNKTLQLVILMICLVYLVGGKIYTLVAWIIDSLSAAIG